MVLALALPCCLPFVYLIPQIVALPILVLTGQMASGRHVPWLPEKLKTRDFDVEAMRSVVARGKNGSAGPSTSPVPACWLCPAPVRRA